MLKNSLKSPFKLTWSIVLHENLSRVGILFRKYPAPTDLWHLHGGYHELVFVLSGNAVNEMKSGKISIGGGDVFVMPAGSVHHYIAMNQFQHYVILIKPEILEELPDFISSMPSFRKLFRGGKTSSEILHVPEKVLPDIVEKIEKAQTEYLNRSSGWLEAFYAGFYSALVSILRYAQPSVQQFSMASYQIGKTVRYMETNLQETHTLKTLSTVAQMSVSNFRLQFRRIMGISPVDYLIRLRLKQAVMQMVYTDLRISEIITQAGFTESSYFSRQFHSVFGRTPREFRKAVKNGTILPTEELERLMQK